MTTETKAIEKKPHNPSVDLMKLSADDIATIKQTCAPADITNSEFRLFLHVAASSGLDPLRRQIHCVRFKSGGPISIVADVNGLQARAEEFPDFRGLKHGIVYEGDEFLFDHAAGQVEKHIGNPFKHPSVKNGSALTPPKPVGAWCIVEREGRSPYVSLVRFDEYYNRFNPLWESKPAVMILKAAKSTCLRLAFPGPFSDVYGQEEMNERELNEPPASSTPPTPPTEEPGESKKGKEVSAKLKAAAAKGRKEQPEDAQVVEQKPVEQVAKAVEATVAATTADAKVTATGTTAPLPGFEPVQPKTEERKLPSKEMLEANGFNADGTSKKPNAAQAIIDACEHEYGMRDNKCHKCGKLDPDAKPKTAPAPTALSPLAKVYEHAALYGVPKEEVNSLLRDELKMTKLGESDVRKVMLAIDDKWANNPPMPTDEDLIPEARQ